MLFSAVTNESVTLMVYVPGMMLSGITQRISHLKSAVGTHERVSPICWSFELIIFKLIDDFWFAEIPIFRISPYPGFFILSPTVIMILSWLNESTSNSVVVKFEPLLTLIFHVPEIGF